MTGSGGTGSYEYKLDAGIYQPAGLFTALSSGSYTVTVRDANLCTFIIPVTITGPASPLGGTITSQLNVDCNGNSTGSVTVAGSAGTSPYEYCLDAGTFQFSGTFGGLAAGNYTITIRDFNLCTFNIPVTITEPLILTGSISSQTDVTCFGEATGQVTINAGGGTMPYQYSFDGGTPQVSPAFMGLAAGSYIVTIEDANHCTFDVPVTITEPLPVIVTITNPPEVCSPSTVDLTLPVITAGSTSGLTFTYWTNALATIALGSPDAVGISGTYYIKGTSPAGCFDIKPVLVTVNPLPEPITGTLNLCIGSTATLSDATPGGSWTSETTAIATIDAGGVVTGVSSGTSVISYTLLTGCAVTATVTINSLPAPTFTLQPGPSTCSGTDVTYSTEPGQSNYLWGVPGTPGTDYSITSGGTNLDNFVTLKWLTAGSKSVTINYTDGNGCSAASVVSSDPTMVNPVLPVSVSIAVDTNPVCAGTAVTFTATPANGGTTPAYQWYNGAAPVGANSPTFNYTPANGDIITVQLTSSETCQSGGPATSNAITMTVNPVLPVSVSIAVDANPVCAGTAVTFTATPANGGTTPAYQWFIGAAPAGTNSPTFNYTPANGDIITVQLTSSETCQSGGPATSNAITMTVNPVLPVSVSITVDVNPVCTGTAVTFTAIPVNGGTTPAFQWYNGAAPVGTNSPTFNYTPANGDIISVQLTSGETCQSGGPATSNAITMTVNPVLPVSVSIAVDANPVCAGTAVTFTAIPVNGGTTPAYQWYNGAAPVGTNSPTFNYTPANGDIITLQLTSSETCQSGGPATSNAITMTVNPVLPVSVSITADANPVCAGTLVTFTATPANGGTTPSYQWYNGAAPVGTNSPAYNYNPSNGDIITVKLTSDETCQSGGPATSNAITMTVNPVLPVSVSIAADANPVCAGTVVTFIATPTNGGITPSFQWYNGAVPVGTNSSVFSYSPSNGDIIIVVLTSDETCQSGGPAASNAVTMAINSIPTGTTTVSNVLCAGSATGGIDLQVSGGNIPYTYLWSNGAITEDLNNITAGTYNVTFTDANLCTGTASGTVTEPAVPLTGSVTAQTNVTVAGGNDGSVTVSGSGGTGTYLYRLDAGIYQALGTFSSLIAGSYTVTIQDANMCTFDVPVTITQPALPLSGTLSSQVDVLCFGASTGSLTVTGLEGILPYEYSLNGVSFQSSGTFSSLAAGTYNVTIRDASLATFVVPVTIIQPATAVTVSTTRVDVLCNGGNTGSATASGIGGTSPYTYSWNTSPVQLTALAANLVAGTFIVTVTDNNGCTSNASVTILQPAALTVTTTQTNALCNGQASGTATAVASGGTGPYSYSWNTSPAQSNATATGLATGSYTVTASDANGCTTTGSVTITEPAPISLEFIPGEAGCPDSPDGTITLNITGGTAPYNILWKDDNSATGRIRSQLLPGTYVAIVTDANFCQAKDSTEVGFTGSYGCLEIPKIITPNGDGINDEWIIRNIDIYPNAELKVYTRWGKLIYKSRNVSADPWDGRFNGRLMPTDSYHYILFLGDGSEPRSGVISIIR